MKTVQKFYIGLIVSLLMQATMASQEGVLPFSEFQIKSNGIGRSGVVIVNGKKDQKGHFVSLSVKAFGKTINIPDAILKKIPSQSQNGILLTYEEGYRILGGRSVYLQFQVGFTSGIRQLFIISVSENAKVQIIE